jgi:probable HAF family extracellular repeat protein
VTALNHSGLVVGQAASIDFTLHAFLYQEGVLKDLGTLGGDNSSANDINAAGHVAGYAETTGGDHRAFLYDGSSLKDLGTLGGASSESVAVNGLNQVVGSSITAAGTWHAMAWTEAGGMVDLNQLIPRAPAGTVLRVAYAVSDNGSIVAQGNTGLVLLKVHQGP